MIHLEEAIVDLLLRHNCVIVPAFGGFVAQSTSAVVDIRNGVMLPPRKSVLFNRQLINNDGLLISFLSANHQLPFAEAETVLKNKTAEWNQMLKDGKRVTIDRIGYLYLDQERNIAFEQDRFFNLLLQSYGLTKVHFIGEEDVKRVEKTLQPTSTVVVEPVRKEIKVDFQPRPIPTHEATPVPASKIVELQPETEEKTTSRKAWRYIAAAVLLPISFYTYWIPMKTDVLESGFISSRDFNPNYHAGEGVYQKKAFSFSLTKEKADPSLEESIAAMPTNVNVYYYKYSDNLYIPIRLDSTEKPNTKKAETSAPDEVELVLVKKDKPKIEIEPKKEAVIASKPMVVSKEKHPHFIVGCFSSKKNALDLIADLNKKGLSGEVADVKNGLTRVSAGGSNNPAEMSKIVNKAKSLGFEGWVLK